MGLPVPRGTVAWMGKAKPAWTSLPRRGGTGGCNPSRMMLLRIRDNSLQKLKIWVEVGIRNISIEKNEEGRGAKEW